MMCLYGKKLYNAFWSFWDAIMNKYRIGGFCVSSSYSNNDSAQKALLLVQTHSVAQHSTCSFYKVFKILTHVVLNYYILYYLCFVCASNWHRT